ncbi:glycosyltransferase family 2 protein [Bizionia psychrotolerans]|uniref:glycosyltransferase family 2 protein n=1 Tax=Bizionia psychrotolerans TaxID=1492901 RepID=UPI0006510184|nr:glycosyltransferase family 2 protein [Bizionia psychrotolerans]
MSHPLVSIIIPSYNSKTYLKEAVSSALSQSYEPIEIIVVDDGSTDDTADLFSEFEAQSVRCYRIKNGGASQARNYGLEQATGDYIQFLDADDILDCSKIAKQLDMMRKHQADVSYTPWIDFKKDITDTHTQFRFFLFGTFVNANWQRLMISYGMNNWFIPTLAWLVKKELIEKAGYWNPAKCPNDDGEYFSRVLFWAEKVVCVNEVLAFYRLTPNDSLSKLNSESKINASFASFLQIEALLLTCQNEYLLSYPKRLNYMQYRLTRKTYPKLAKRAAGNFDRIQAPSFLSKKRYYWFFIKKFGLYNGSKIYMLLQPLWGLVINGKNRK